jgi:formylmethanofuran dehydrogenase subunit E
MDDYDYFLKKVADFHGHICRGILTGTRMALTAMRYLELDPYGANRNIIVYTEIDRCMSDAVMVITGCSPGRRSLKFVDYGKFAMTIINQETGKAVRTSMKDNFPRSDNIEEMKKIVAAISDAEMFTLQDVEVNIPKFDLPGFPLKTTVCSACGEQIMDGRDIDQGGIILCRGCALGTYYTIGKKQQRQSDKNVISPDLNGTKSK